jgi:ribosomal protein S18 acetylase RimI-like enzyme
VRLDRQRNRRGFEACPLARGEESDRDMAAYSVSDQRAIEIGAHEVRLYTNQRMEQNLALYRRHGFVEVGTRPHPSRPGEVLVDMTKMLRPSTSV